MAEMSFNHYKDIRFKIKENKDNILQSDSKTSKGSNNKLKAFFLGRGEGFDWVKVAYFY